MKKILISFVLGLETGALLLSLYLSKKEPLKLDITQEKGVPLKVVSNTLDRKSELTTILYSEPTGKITLTQKIPPQSGWYLRLGVMPNFSSNGFGMGGLVGVEYRTGRLGYFLDTFYDPLQKQGGITLGLSIKLTS